jgi:hypothetical protein
MTTDLKRWSLQGLAMIYIFTPPFPGTPEYALSGAVRKELVRRGALKIIGDTQDIWQLDENVQKELNEVACAMVEMFRQHVKKEEE